MMKQDEDHGQYIAKKAHFQDDLLTTYVVPQGCERIEDWAFAYCTNLHRIDIPMGCRVSEKAFLGCERLEQVVVYQTEAGRSDGRAKEAEANDAEANGALLALAFRFWPADSDTALGYAGEEALFYQWFDDRLMSYLQQDDAADYHPFLAGGEEDYEDEETGKEAFMQTVRMGKIRLILQRLYAGGHLLGSYEEHYVSCLEQSGPALFFAAAGRGEQSRMAAKAALLQYDLFAGLPAEELLSYIQEDVEQRAIILQRRFDQKPPAFDQWRL